MNLFEEVIAISNSSLSRTKYEFDNIASKIKLTALTGSRSVYILGSISKPVKEGLLLSINLKQVKDMVTLLNGRSSIDEPNRITL